MQPAGKLLLITGIVSANTVPSHVARKATERETPMQLSEDQFNRQKDYSTTVFILDAMKKQGLISDKDFLNEKDRLIEKYHPILIVNS